MINRDLQLKLINKTLSNGGEYADIYLEYRKQTFIVVDDKKIENVVTGTVAGAGIRLIYNGKTIYAFSNDLSGEALTEAAEKISKAAAGKSTDIIMNLEIRRPKVDFRIKLFPPDIPLERKISLVRRVDNAARDHDRRIKQVIAKYVDTIQKIEIAASDGFISEDERVYSSAIIQATASQEDIIQTGYEAIGGNTGFELFLENDIEELSIAAAERAIMMLTAGRAPGGRMPVVIASGAGGTMIHEAIGHGLEADLAQQGLSVFSGKLGCRVASELITVIDDATLEHRRGSFRFDDEGVPSQRTVLVENGILKKYMYDRLTSMKDGEEPTGNGRRESYRHRPIPRMSNTFIARGETPPEEILRSLEKGLFIEKIGGGQVNTISGDFVFEVQEGYLIENGKKGEPVRGATLTGNGNQILESIDMVGNDLGFAIGTCGKDGQGVPISDAMPTVRIPEIVVGGACD
ncbi:MAG: TldD/PmbA family protein, partial [Nitrospirota bacterium]|nr:TldD/PmbA family protein [Nitrospirota bacterium]